MAVVLGWEVRMGTEQGAVGGLEEEEPGVGGRGQENRKEHGQRASWMRSMLTCSYLGEEPENLLCDVPSLLAVGEERCWLREVTGWWVSVSSWGPGERRGRW